MIGVRLGSQTVTAQRVLNVTRRLSTASAMPSAKVGVVSTTGCPYCKRAKDSLTKQNVEYAEAQLGEARDVLAKVKETTGQSTVPQVFIGGEFVGGQTELQQLIDSNKLQSKLKSAKGGAFPKDIASLLEKHVQSAQDQGPSKEEKRAAELADLLEKHLKWPESEIKGQKVRAHTAADIAKLLESHVDDGDVAGAAEVLLRTRELAPAVAGDESDGAKFDPQSTAQRYQLTRIARARGVKKGNPLNEHIPWWGAARAAATISGDLRGRILELYDTHLASDGTAVDYEALGKDARYARYVDATAELQKADLGELSKAERMAFFINVYNALIIHATVELGTPANLLKRLTFFGEAKYRIGKDTYSANDIEHGILRDNATSPASLGGLTGIKALAKPQLKEGDLRRAFVVSPVDPRIHFALVCGAKSCPPIKLYTPTNLDEGLQEAASAFSNGEIEVDMASKTVTASKIFKWYGADFAAEPKERLKVWAGYCSGELAQNLRSLAEGGDKVHFKYKEYDWSSNSK